MPSPIQHFPVKMKFAGVDLRAAVDQLGPGRFRVAKNLKPTIEGALMTREGTSLVAATPLASLPVHSLSYLNDPVNAASILLAGAGASVYNLNTQASLDTGYSGNPFSQTQYRGSGDSSAFAIIADSDRMSKFTSAGVRTQLGITPPASQVTVTAGPALVTNIDAFTVDHFAYHNMQSHTVASSFANGVVAKDTEALQVQTASPLPSGFANLTYVTALNLTEVGGQPAGDGDYFHLWFNIDNPSNIQEIRIMFDVDPASVTAGSFNSYSFTGNFYWASVTGAALQAIINNTETTLSTRAAALASAQTTVAPFPPGFSPSISPTNPDTAYATQTYTGAIQWTELKIPRSQFTRAGANGALGWATVQGFSITIIPTLYTQPVITLNDLYFFGGYSPDSSYGTANYDYIQTWKSSVTQDESNPSPIQLGADGSDNNGLGPDYSETSLAQVYVSDGGASYVVGDVLTLGTGTGGQVLVLSAPGGVAETLQIIAAGYNYTAGDTEATTGGSGTGCTITVVATGSGLPLQRTPGVITPLISPDSQVDTCVFYRRGGTLDDDWRNIGQNANATINITGISWSNGILTVTTNIAHQFLLEQGIQIAGGSTAGIVGYWNVTATGTGGGIATQFSFALASNPGALVGTPTVVICDLESDTDIASASTAPQTNDVPVTTVNNSGITVYAQPLAFIWGPFNGNTIFGCGDPNRPGFAYWCNPGNPDGWSSFQNVEVTQPSDPLQNGFYWGGSPWVFSQNKLFQLVPAQVGVNAYVPVQTVCNNGLYCRWGLAAGPDTPAVWYVANDGIYEIEPGSTPTCITDDDIYPLFNGLTVEGNAPIDFSQETKIRMAYFDEEVWFTFVDTLGNQQVWIYERSQSWVYDRPKRRWRQASYPSGPLCIYPQPYAHSNVTTTSNILFLGGANGLVYQQKNNILGSQIYTDAGAPISCAMRTGSYDFEDPQQWKEFVSIVTDYIANGASITPTALYNDEATSVALPALTGGATRVQVDQTLSDSYARSFSFQLAWAASVAVVIEGFEIAWRPDELPVTHTEVPANAFDMPGYGHVYDGYIGLRSVGAVNLTITTQDPNGYAPQVVSFASTGGARQRIYLQFSTNKARNFRVSLDSADGNPFRVYPEDSYINLMPWGAITPTPVQLPFKA